nr:TetR/AcrR family transcriptional regulator [Rhizobium sp. CCGE 510]
MRQRQKQERTDRILESAAAMFREKGFEATRVDDIAEAANLSPATFYNYFHNKGDILLATLLLEENGVIAAGDRIIKRQIADVEEALNALVGAYYDNSLVYVTKEMWRQAMAMTIQQSSAPFARQYLEIDDRLRIQIAALLRDLQTRGLLKADLDTEQVGAIVFNNINMTFIDYVRSDDRSIADVMEFVKRQNATLTKMIEKTGA